MHKNRKIKNFIIYPSFQLKMVLILLGTSLIAPTILLIFQNYLYHLQMINGQMMKFPADDFYFVVVSDFQQKTDFVFKISMLLSFVVSLVVGIVVSHRIAGPLVKMKKHFETKGLTPTHDEPLHFREGDFFKDLANAYNLRFKSLNK